jgi:hypothetical protein
MKPLLMKRTVLNIFFFLFLFILVFRFVHQIVVGYAKESWKITEFLINYQGGFVRRGLLGEIILYLYNCTGLSPYILIISICIISYVTLIWFIIKSFIKNGYTLFILPFVFFLGNPIINNFWVRKDILLILIFISIIYFSLKKSNWHLIFVNLFFIVGLLIHESIGFFCFPILLLILVSQKSNFSKDGKALIKSIITSISQLIPSIFTFLCVLYFKGSQSISSHIWASWKPIEFPIQDKDNSQIPTAIDGLSWSLKQGLSLTVQTLKNFNGDVYAPIAWFLIILIIYYIVTNISKLNYNILNYKPYKNFNKANLSNVLFFQLLAIIPLFILGWDYSRWVFYWITTSFAIVILVPEKKLSIVFPDVVSTTSTKINTFLDLLIGKSNVLLLCVMIGFNNCSWDFFNSINSGSVVIILQFFSKALHQLLLLVKEVLL